MIVNLLALPLMQSQLAIAPEQSLRAQIAGECRQLQRLERIYSDADLGSAPLGNLSRGAIVTLAGEVNQPSAGWIRISAPFDGYILATFLAPCAVVLPPLPPLPPLPSFRIPPAPAPLPPPRFQTPPPSIRIPPPVLQPRLQPQPPVRRPQPLLPPSPSQPLPTPDGRR
ncbi:hypothetical protein [Microcoleus sp. FACHB-1515]|uniref:hypothetical protein n=2 Tax=Cyanophyceae TaxID=3028117 RepID=UPI001A7EBF6B|nr:hypothetical protein [Microcoleus sp. FACHB-1515]